ncbi:conserved unknown protein [Ectocarpus siliculosus]|uniref:AB hydrolase-1 domain-containing protein n=1 Tax=Ectocarpus siliculosus TaxID=2880 RepID=D8LNT7_ECTSI|nr:conserved unknown protein [Ectocarpus siliculosus]|eukprot:CBN78297.1 conserved unknown protein [Ectocarpus siliculosus]
MVRQLVRFLKMAAIIARCRSAGLSGFPSTRPMCFSFIAPVRSSSSFTSGSWNGRGRTTATQGSCIDHSGRRSGGPSMSAGAAVLSSSTKKKVARPAGAAKLESIDFNPSASSSSFTPVVIMHGLLGNSRNFQGWGAKLVKSLDQERRVFAVDMRNHGASSHHDSMTYVDMANDVLGFLADKGLSEAVLIGHSMGGKAAAMTALLHPQVVKGLVVMDIAPVSYSMVDATNWGETQKIIEAIHKMPLEGVTSRRDADELLAKDIVDPALRAFAVTNLDKDPASGGWAWRINIDAIQRSMGVLAQFDSGKRHQEEIDGRLKGGGRGDGDADELGAYKGDALFVAGGNSRYIRSQHLKEIGKLFPRFVVSTIKGAGHWVHADNPTETLRLAKSFLDRPELG